MRIETFEQLKNFGAGRQFSVSKAHQRKARERWGIFKKTFTLNKKIELERLNLSEKWTIRQHEFYDLDPTKENIDNDDTFWMFEEDLLQIEFDDYIIDLGWYGGQNGEYCLYLLRGNFLNGELLVKFRTPDRLSIVSRLKCLIEEVESGILNDIRGYKFSEDNERNINDFNDFRVKRK